MNLAAETHVDRSIDGPAAFVQTNIVGTFVLLEESRRHVGTLPDSERAAFRFLHVSTDEVYGSLGPEGLFREETPYAPNSPYAASKASADHLVRAYVHTYGLPAIVTNCSNNFGPRQHTEKLIPKIISNCMNEKPIPIYGDGKNVRDWIFVEDHCGGIKLALEKGKLGESYCFGGECEMRNIEIANLICEILDEKRPKADGSSYKAQINFVQDRAGHDYRYAIDNTKVKKELGFIIAKNFKEPS